MSNKQISFGEGYVVQEGSPRYLQGRIFTIIEALGLKEIQEKSLKDLIQKEIWDEFNSAVFINSSLNDEIRKCYEEIKNYKSDGNPPLSIYEFVFTVNYKKIE